jgi:hypothetical protein
MPYCEVIAAGGPYPTFLTRSKISRAKRAADLATVQIIAERAANLLDEIRKYIVFEGSPDIIEVLNEFAEQHTDDSP